MTVIDWSENLSLKIKLIDEQHKKLIDLINDFYDGINKSSSKEKIFEMINAMKNYAGFHFSTEENLLQRYNFPDYQNHRNTHDKFIVSVNNFEERFKSGKLLLSLEITNFIKEWITNHIMKTDKQYADFLIKNGVH